MPILFLICGAPFSGKTTLAKGIVELKKYSYVGLDELLKKKGFDLSKKIPMEEWEKVHQESFRLLRSLMNKKETIVLDDTLYLKKLRNRFRKIAESFNYQIVTIYLNIPIETLEERRKKILTTNERHYPKDEEFYNVIHNFETPGVDENTIVYDGIQEMDEWIKLI